MLLRWNDRKNLCQSMRKIREYLLNPFNPCSILQSNQKSLIFLLVITFCEDSSFVGMTSEQRKNPRASAKPIQSVFHPVLTFFFFCHYVLRRLLRQFAVARVLLRRNDKRTEKKSAIICYIHLIHVPSRFDILLFLSFRRRRNRTRALHIFMN